jgi:hypothetical protein
VYSLWLRRAGHRREHAQVRRIARPDQSWVRRFAPRSRVPRGRSASARGSLTTWTSPFRGWPGGVTKGDMSQSMTPLLLSARSSSRGLDPVERVAPSRGRRARCTAELHSVSSLVKSLSRPGMRHADSSDWPSLAIGGARTMGITSRGNGYRRSPPRTDEPKPRSRRCQCRRRCLPGLAAHPEKPTLRKS